MFLNKKQKPKNMCVLLDSGTSRVLARGSLEGPPEGINVQVNITEGDIQAVVAADTVQVVPADEDTPPKLGHVIQRKTNLLILETLRDLTKDRVRENLRMPVDFETFLYPMDGRPGRYTARSNDLSCGGISFSCEGISFQPGEQVQVVIPITRTAPLLLACQVLRRWEESGVEFYAAKFLDLLNEQESMLRESVFNVQLKSLQRMNRR